MDRPVSLAGQKSRVFEGIVGRTVPADQFPARDCLIDDRRFACEGNWAFCRFDNPDMPAARMGFTRRGFDGGKTEKPVDRNFLQLHLELVTKQGLILWLASGRYPAEQVSLDDRQMDMRLAAAGAEIFSMSGWPRMACHFRTDDGEAQADLQFDFQCVTTLPDCILPRAIFGMWEALGSVRGTIRYQQTTTAISGKVFFDHPRIIHQASGAVMRQMYLYTTMYFADGSFAVGYHALDETLRPIDYYCFGLYVDAAGNGRFLPDARTTAIAFDPDHIPESWHIRWSDGDLLLDVDIAAQRDEIVRAWGGPKVPARRKDFIFLPLVFKGEGKIVQAGKARPVTARGLAEYYDIDL